jgi:hypothetical protein
MPEFSVRDLRCIETRYTVPTETSQTDPAMPPIPEGFQRRVVEVRIGNDGVAEATTLDVESPYRVA